MPPSIDPKEIDAIKKGQIEVLEKFDKIDRAQQESLNKLDAVSREKNVKEEQLVSIERGLSTLEFDRQHINMEREVLAQRAIILFNSLGNIDMKSSQDEKLAYEVAELQKRDKDLELLSVRLRNKQESINSKLDEIQSLFLQR